MKKWLSWLLVLAMCIPLGACSHRVTLTETEEGFRVEEDVASVPDGGGEPTSTPEPTAEPTPSPTPEPLAFAEEHGWQFYAPMEVTVPVTQSGEADYIEFYPVETVKGAPVITRSEPDDEGYVTYTVTYDSPNVMEFYFEGEAGSLSSSSEDYDILDYYTGAKFPVSLYIDLAVGDRYDESDIGTLIEYNGTTYEVFCQAEMSAGEQSSDVYDSGNGSVASLFIPATCILTIRTPEDYDGLVIGLDPVTPLVYDDSSSMEITYWDDFDNVDNWIFVRLDDYISA